MLDPDLTLCDLLRQLRALGWRRDYSREKGSVLAAFRGPSHTCGSIELLKGVDVNTRLPTWWQHLSLPRLGLMSTPISIGEEYIAECRRRDAAVFRRKMLEPCLDDFEPVCSAQAEQRAAWEASSAFKRGFAREFCSEEEAGVPSQSDS